jgi:capsular polysaccharide biosynthesis protein
VPGAYCTQTLEWLRGNLLPAFGIRPQPPQRLVYVSRSKAGSRRVLNEDAIVTRLEARGFEIVHLEGMTVKQQLELFSSAAVVVMPAGAAGINMVFASPGATLIELHPSGYQHPMHFVHCSLIGCEYGCFICDDSASPGTQDMTVDAEALVAVIDALLERKSLPQQLALQA